MNAISSAVIDIAHTGVCYHCGLPTAGVSGRYVSTIQNTAREFCCPGCQSVSETISAMGMDIWYEARERDAARQPPVQWDAMQLEALTVWDTPSLAAACVHREADGQETVTLSLEGMTCAACGWLIETRLAKTSGVSRVRLNLAQHRATVTRDPDVLSLSDLLRSIAAIGYRAEPWQPDREDAQRKRESRYMLMRIGLAGLGAMQVMMFAVGLYAGDMTGIDTEHARFLRTVSALITLPVLLFSGAPFLRGAWRSLRESRIGMDVPVSIALLMAYTASLYATAIDGPDVYFDSVCMFIFFLLTGRWLEMRARHRAATSALNAVGQRHLTALRLDDDGHTTCVPADALTPADRLLVRPGDVIACDAIVVEGESSVNEAMLTGEPLPVNKQLGDAVLSGSINMDQPLTLRVTRPAASSTLHLLRRLFERAQSEKPRQILIADRIAHRLTARILLLAALTFAGWWWVRPEDAFWIALSVLVITCPCAIGLAMPVALTTATSTLADRGFLITRAHVLETLARITHVVFDKTGTLTEGRFAVLETRSFSPEPPSSCLAVAHALESGSAHPVARAFDSTAVPALTAHDLHHHPHRGMEGAIDGRRYRIGTRDFVAGIAQQPAPSVGDGLWIWLAREDAWLAAFRLDDHLREGADDTVRALQSLGAEVHLLSGDPSDQPERIADALGIRHVRGHADPAAKLAYLQALQDRGCVLMVGDGLNDAPVLAAADVSVALAAGSDLARLSADVLLLRNDLHGIIHAIHVARYSQHIIRQNIHGSLLYNLVAVTFAALGMVPPWAAAIGMSASSLGVVLNAQRVRRFARRAALTRRPGGKG